MTRVSNRFTREELSYLLFHMEGRHPGISTRIVAKLQVMLEALERQEKAEKKKRG